jgi:hypothetical protein
MKYFAKVSKRIVEQVIVAEVSFFDTFVDTSPGSWIETFIDGGVRKNWAGIGYTYDKTRDAFIPPQPYPSWTLNEDTCQWTPPTPYPSDNKDYEWDESTLSWIEQEV